jgi:hypothetical protein
MCRAVYSLLPITTITTDTVLFVEGGKDTFSLDIDTVYSYIGVQGFVTSGYTGQKSSFVATQVGTPEATAIHEINAVPEAKYLFVGLKSKNYNAISQTGYQLLLNAVEYLLSQEAFNTPTAKAIAYLSVMPTSIPVTAFYILMQKSLHWLKFMTYLVKK